MADAMLAVFAYSFVWDSGTLLKAIRSGNNGEVGIESVVD